MSDSRPVGVETKFGEEEGRTRTRTPPRFRARAASGACSGPIRSAARSVP